MESLKDKAGILSVVGQLIFGGAILAFFTVDTSIVREWSTPIILLAIAGGGLYAFAMKVLKDEDDDEGGGSNKRSSSQGRDQDAKRSPRRAKSRQSPKTTEEPVDLFEDFSDTDIPDFDDPVETGERPRRHH